ncbi:hypothetical protein ACF3NG_02170 [Aerococcaceae bacterium WGS1372]
MSWPNSSVGVTDASNLLIEKPDDFDFIVFGLGETALAHEVNEHVYNDTYFIFIDIF